MSIAQPVLILVRNGIETHRLEELLLWFERHRARFSVEAPRTAPKGSAA